MGMPSKHRISVGVLLVFVAFCGLATWLAKLWLIREKREPRWTFALIGPMDIDRDGRDDRAAVREMIMRNGGYVDYDLPLSGEAVGRLEPDTQWYIESPVPKGAAAPAEFVKAKRRAISEARANGTRPMPLHRALGALNYGK